MKKFIFFILISFTIYCQDRIVAIVGNKPIFEKEVIFKSKSEKIDYKTAFDLLIEEKLLLSQVEKKDIKISREELTKEIDSIKKKLGLENFYEYLKLRNITYVQFEEEILKSLKIRKLIKEEIINKIEISPVEIAKEMEKLETNNYLFEFYFKWFERKEDGEFFIKNFNEEKIKEMEYGKLKGYEIRDEILSLIKILNPGEISNPLEIDDKYLVVYLKNKEAQKVEKYQLYSETKDRIFKTKYSIAYKSFIEKLKNEIPVKIFQ